MPATPASEELTITLPKDLADIVRGKVASGEYASEMEYVRYKLGDDILPPIDPIELEHWLQTEVPLRCAEADAHPELLLTADDMRQAIAEELEAIRNEQ